MAAFNSTAFSMPTLLRSTLALRGALSASLISLVFAASPHLAVAQSTDAPRSFSDSALTAYRARPSAMATSRFAALWTASPGGFLRGWDSSYAGDRRALNRASQTADRAQIARESIRLRLRYLWGRVTYPYFHWRESAAPNVVPDPAVPRLVASLPLADTLWWPLPEHGALVDALVHEKARHLLSEQLRLQNGDVRWLRAEFTAAQALFRDPALVGRVTTRLIEKHLDENGSRGIDSVRGQWLAMRPDSLARSRVDSMIAADLTMRDGHVIETYQTIGDVALEAHVLRPTGGDSTGRRPAMLWFHGGSGTSGIWWHSPGVVNALRANGVTVVAVEYRTGNRFDAGPIDQATDAVRAYEWTVRNADRLEIDRQRIGVAGFSSGTTLALLLGTRGIGRMDRPPADSGRTYPAAIIVSGACPAPAGPREDGYFRKTISRIGRPADYSPIDLVASGQPPMLVVQGTKDEYCAFEDARAFVERSTSAGNDATLSAVEGASHFFGFYYPPGQRQLREAIRLALHRWGWAAP